MNPGLAELVRHMTQLEPDSRHDMHSYLRDWPAAVFPEFFEPLHDLLSPLMVWSKDHCVLLIKASFSQFFTAVRTAADKGADPTDGGHSGDGSAADSAAAAREASTGGGERAVHDSEAAGGYPGLGQDAAVDDAGRSCQDSPAEAHWGAERSDAAAQGALGQAGDDAVSRDAGAGAAACGSHEYDKEGGRPGAGGAEAVPVSGSGCVGSGGKQGLGESGDAGVAEVRPGREEGGAATAFPVAAALGHAPSGPGTREGGLLMAVAKRADEVLRAAQAFAAAAAQPQWLHSALTLLAGVLCVCLRGAATIEARWECIQMLVEVRGCRVSCIA